VRRRSIQPIIIGRKAPKFLKSLWEIFGISGPEVGPVPAINDEMSTKSLDPAER
jgi:hypothetical protein